MKDIIFREYDIRGVVGTELYINEIYNVTCAIVYYFHQHNPAIKTLAVGMDGRIHSPTIKDEMCRALIDSGINVLFLGVCPTPALYFSLFTQKVDGGLMITASHNAKEYNGIKICLGTESVWGKELQKIKELYKKRVSLSASQKGSLKNYPIIPDYISWLSHHFSSLKKMNLPVIIDCGNGTAGTVLPDLITEMQWPAVQLLYPEVDGTYPHHEADPTVAANMEQLKKSVTKSRALGIGLDGDCDRMVPMTKEGNLVPGDQLLALFAQQLLQHHPESTVVFDIKSSASLIKLLEKWKAHPIMSPSGHSIIKKTMQQHNALLGGELSCHFFFKDRYFGYDDGIYAMLRLFEIIVQSHQSLSELLTLFPRTFSTQEFRLACTEERKKPIIAELIHYFSTLPETHVITLDGVRVTFPFGWGIIRPSNTQAMLSIRCESDTHAGLQKIMNLFYASLKPYLSSSSLQPFVQQMESV